MDATHPQPAPRAVAPARYGRLAAGLLAGVGLAIALPGLAGNAWTPEPGKPGRALHAIDIAAQAPAWPSDRSWGSPSEGQPMPARREPHGVVEASRWRTTRLRLPSDRVGSTALAGLSFRPPFHSITQGYP